MKKILHAILHSRRLTCGSSLVQTDDFCMLDRVVCWCRSMTADNGLEVLLGIKDNTLGI